MVAVIVWRRHSTKQEIILNVALGAITDADRLVRLRRRINHNTLLYVLVTRV